MQEIASSSLAGVISVCIDPHAVLWYRRGSNQRSSIMTRWIILVSMTLLFGGCADSCNDVYQNNKKALKTVQQFDKTCADGTAIPLDGTSAPTQHKITCPHKTYIVVCNHQDGCKAAAMVCTILTEVSTAPPR
jgi:hypothetical protein